MSWWPFIANQWAWLFLLLVPLVIFYFLKLKRPRLEIPSLALWRSVLNDQRVNSPFQRFKRNILLLLQILLLLCLVLGAMQPFVPSGADRANYLPVLIDTSASSRSVRAANSNDGSTAPAWTILASTEGLYPWASSLRLVRWGEKVPAAGGTVCDGFVEGDR